MRSVVDFVQFALSHAHPASVPKGSALRACGASMLVMQPWNAAATPPTAPMRMKSRLFICVSCFVSTVIL